MKLHKVTRTASRPLLLHRLCRQVVYLMMEDVDSLSQRFEQGAGEDMMDACYDYQDRDWPALVQARTWTIRQQTVACTSDSIKQYT